ncbi:MAG: hypothetical protein IT184_11865 [Acidobacteria bacterium]|nr:hypothetical protein [Acidobacteriota bacterium]
MKKPHGGLARTCSLQDYHSAMASFDDAVDQLYQAPLADFVARRRALAQQQPAKASVVNGLQKPTLSAWTVNRLFWTRRTTLERLTRAAERVRDVQLRRLSGKPAADLEAAERAHRAAIDRAVADASAILEESNQPASTATLQAVRETLETVPWTTLDGRLVRPIKPTGLEALSALMAGGRLPQRSPAKVLPMRPRTSHADAETPASARAAQAKRRHEIAALERQWREAGRKAAQALAAVEKANRAVRRAEDDRARAEAVLERTRTTLEEQRKRARQAELVAQEAARTRDALQAQVAAAKQALV